MSQNHLSDLRFDSLVINEKVQQGIRDAGFEFCTPIQANTLPIALEGHDVAGHAQTGTGKTAAFLITILARQWEYPLAEPLPPGTPRALVLAPTRELALQVAQRRAPGQRLRASLPHRHPSAIPRISGNRNCWAGPAFRG